MFPVFEEVLSLLFSSDWVLQNVIPLSFQDTNPPSCLPWNLLFGLIVLVFLISGHMFSTWRETSEEKEIIQVFPGIGIQNRSVFLPIEVLKDVVIVEHIPNLWDIRFLLIAICHRPTGSCVAQSTTDECPKNNDVLSPKNNDVIGPKNNDVIGPRNNDVIGPKNNDVVSPRNVDVVCSGNDVIVPLLCSGKNVKLEALKQAYQMIHQAFNLSM